MAEERTSEILLGAFVGVEAAHAYSAFLPSIFTIRTFTNGDGLAAADIREGELFGTAYALALGAIVAKLTRSPLPLLFAGVTAVVMISVYEYALRTAHTHEVSQ